MRRAPRSASARCARWLREQAIATLLAIAHSEAAEFQDQSLLLSARQALLDFGTDPGPELAAKPAIVAKPVAWYKRDAWPATIPQGSHHDRGNQPPRRLVGADADLAAIAQRTPGLSGAFLANIINEAATLATL